MPVFELHCPVCNQSEDKYFRRWDDPDPECSACGGPRSRLVGRFGFPFSGSIHKYMDPKREGAHMDGFWQYRKLSSVSGQPEPVFIDSMQALREFNSVEGLAAPGEVPTNSTVSADGKRILSDGMPGQWRGSMPELPSAVARMTKSLTSLTGNDPAPSSSGPPCTVEAADASIMQSFAG